MKLKHLKETRRILLELHRQIPLKKMERLLQHGTTSTYQHSLNVAFTSVWLAEKLPLQIDLHSLVIGAMLHDFYCYDWHDHDPSHRWHGFRHPKRALEEALRYVALDENSQNIILNHMWPLTFRHFPMSKEAWLVCLADKGCALAETLRLCEGLEKNTLQWISYAAA